MDIKKIYKSILKLITFPFPWFAPSAHSMPIAGRSLFGMTAWSGHTDPGPAKLGPLEIFDEDKMGNRV